MNDAAPVLCEDGTPVMARCRDSRGREVEEVWTKGEQFRRHEMVRKAAYHRRKAIERGEQQLRALGVEPDPEVDRLLLDALIKVLEDERSKPRRVVQLRLSQRESVRP
jgi:hypothetical protein